MKLRELPPALITALDDLDDFARMAGVQAVGALETSRREAKATQLEAARDALEAAARLADADHYGEWLAKAIRAIPLEQP